MKNINKNVSKSMFSSSISKLLFAFLVLMVFTFTIGIIDAEAQCAMCRATVETNFANGDGGASTRLNSGILYLLSMPYLLAGMVAFVWYRNNQKNKRNGKRTLKISSSPAM